VGNAATLKSPAFVPAAGEACPTLLTGLRNTIKSIIKGEGVNLREENLREENLRRKNLKRKNLELDVEEDNSK